MRQHPVKTATIMPHHSGWPS